MAFTLLRITFGALVATVSLLVAVDHAVHHGLRWWLARSAARFTAAQPGA